MAANVTAEQVRELLNYDADTGVFTWAKSRVGVRKGDVAGSVHRNGYAMLGILYHARLAHRVAWLHHYGQWPAGEIDHINGIRNDNRLANLRDVTTQVNRQNVRGARSDNKASGLLGVFRNGVNWAARIETGGKRTHLGTYKTPELAHSAYMTAKRQLHAGCTI